jgi:predicted dehydrogenase
MTTIRWGILSTGRIADAFAQALTYLPDAQIVAVGSRNQGTADTFASKFNIPNAFDTYEAVANHPEVDVIYVATPQTYHAENTLLCLQAGKHVLCEKPFTINAKEAEACIKLAREKNLFLMEAVWMRYIPAMVQVREWIKRGEIGEVLLVQADFSIHKPLDPEHRLYRLDLGGGSLLDVGIYPLSLATMVMGLPKTVHSQVIMGNTGVDEQTAILFGYEGGKAAILSSGISAHLPNNAIIKGTEGYIEVHYPFWFPHQVSLHKHGMDTQTENIPFANNGLNYEAAEVQSCLRAGKLESSIMPLDETLGILRLMDGIRAEWGLKYPTE